MKTKMILMGLLMLVGSYASAATMLVEDGISWTANMTGVGTQTGTITLNVNTSGASFAGGVDGYLAGIGIKNLGGDFKITSVSLTDWSANNKELNASGVACAGGTGSADKRGCAFAENLGARPSSVDGNFAIVLGLTLDSGALLDTFHLKVRWEDINGKKIGDLISQDLTAVPLPAVPLPAAAWLFGSALVGLTAVARRRDKKAPLVA